MPVIAGHHNGFNPFRDTKGRWAAKGDGALSVGPAPQRRLDGPEVHISGAIHHEAHLLPLGADEPIAYVHRGVRVVLRPPVPGVTGDGAGTKAVAVVFDSDGQVAGVSSLPKSLSTPRALAKATEKAVAKIAAANAAADARRTPGARQMLTDDDVRSFVAEHQDWLRRQTPEQAREIYLYQKDSNVVNAALRAGVAPADLTGDAAKMHAGLSQQLTGARADFRTYRGVNTAFLGGELDVGQTFTEKGWSSTSRSDAFVKDYATRADGSYAKRKGETGKVQPGIFEITVPKGQTYVPTMKAREGSEQIPAGTRFIKAAAPEQPAYMFGEVVLPPGTTYRVAGKRYVPQGGKRVPVYTMEIIQ